MRNKYRKACHESIENKKKFHVRNGKKKQAMAKNKTRYGKP